MPSPLSLLAAAAALGSAVAEPQPCKGALTCRHGASCDEGEADYGFLRRFPDLPFLSTTSVDNEHCVCPSDRTAVDCGTKLLVCDTSTGFTCFNNADCTSTRKGEDHCDCTVAHKDGHKFFAGKYCEHQATDVCETTEDGLEGDEWFCVNNGLCRNKESDINKKCNCPTGWTGPHCEFQKYSFDAPKVEECSLECKNGGQCKHGSKGYANLTALYEAWAHKEVDGMHCVCPEGYAGVECEMKAEKCGKLFCFHGSKCVKEEDAITGETREHCDCTTAGENAKTYAGKWCEHESTTFCDPVNGKASICVNNGKCRHDKIHMGCECKEGFSGPLCEYSGEEQPPCTLDCQNGGQCRHGINPDVAGILGSKFDISLPAHEGFMHCSCPEGYLGVDCSVKYEVCGKKEEARHACANGGKCIITGTKKNGKPEYACDCGYRNPFAGAHCEHAATRFCAKSEEAEGSYHSFCTNGGKCAEIINPNESHPGCECPEEWEGEHCQYKKGTTPAVQVQGSQDSVPAANSSGKSPGTKFGIAVAVLSILGLIGTFAVVTLRRRMANAMQKSIEDTAPVAAHDAADNRPTSDTTADFQNEEHLQDVEII